MTTQEYNLTDWLAQRERLDDPYLNKIWTMNQLQAEVRSAAADLARACVEHNRARRAYEAAQARLKIYEGINNDEQLRKL